MKLRIERDVFADAVGWAVRCLPNRATVPVLAAMVIEAGELLSYRRYVLTIPRIHVEAGGLASTYEQGIVYEVRNNRILRSLGYKEAASALIKLGHLLRGTDSDE